jgi:class 3 adenylate cyclase
MLVLAFWILCFDVNTYARSSNDYDKIDVLISNAKRALEKTDSISYSLELLKRANQDALKVNYPKGIMRSSYELGLIALLMSDYPSAIGSFYECLEASRSSADSISESKAYLGLGLVMYNLNKWSDAVKFFESSMSVDTRKSKYLGGSTQEYLLGLCYYRQSQLERSSILLNKVKAFADRNNNEMRKLEAILYLTNIASQKEAREDLLIRYDSLYQIFMDRGEKMGVCFTLEGKARSLYHLGRTKEAAEAAYESLDLAKKMNTLYPRYAILDILIKAEYKSENYKESSNMMMELRELKNETMSEKSNTEVVMQVADYEFNKKEEVYTNEINFNKRQRIVFAILALVFLSLAVFIFMSRRGIAKERKRSDDLLHNILPDATAKELKQFGFAKAKAHPNATIVFADVKSFTTIAKDLEPQVLVEMLDVYFSKFDYLVKHNGLEKIKTIGDAYMFVAGLDGDDQVLSAKAAVRTSLAIVQAIKDCESEMLNNYGIDFKFRFGIHTGNVVSGVVGSIKYAFDIWGDAVNIAARMEECGKPELINISAVTYDLVAEDFDFESRGNIAIKNRGEMGMYFVKNKKGLPLQE